MADKYDSVWSPLTQQFIPSLLEDANVSAGMFVLDVACGPEKYAREDKFILPMATHVVVVSKPGC